MAGNCAVREENVVIKGVKDGLLILLDPREEWPTVTAELAARIDEKLDFFAGARITVDLGERPVPKYDLSSLKALLERRGLALVVVQSESETTIESAYALDLRINTTRKGLPRNAGGKPAPVRESPVDSEEEGTTGVMIKRTLRSGRTVRSPGHVVIYGDVNPGAEIIAGGDVIIWGRLRGNVHAGANGDESAFVCALDMIPMQLRIAGLIAISPPDKRRKAGPEIALIRANQIVVEAWE